MEVQNVVATVNLKTPLDLRKLSVSSDAIQESSHAVVMRLGSLGVRLSCSSGKLVARVPNRSAGRARGSTPHNRKIGFPVQFTGHRLQNVVATVNVGFPFG